jgi:hypothetical protein
MSGPGDAYQGCVYFEPCPTNNREHIFEIIDFPAEKTAFAQNAVLPCLEYRNSGCKRAKAVKT